MRLHVSVHDSFGMAEIERFEQFSNVVSDIEVGEFRVEGFEFRVLILAHDSTLVIRATIRVPFPTPSSSPPPSAAGDASSSQTPSSYTDETHVDIFRHY